MTALPLFIHISLRKEAQNGLQIQKKLKIYQKRKKEAERAKEKMDSLVAGTVIKTIGLIEGEIVEVYENDLLIKSGESTLKIDKRAVYQILSTPNVEEPFAEQEQAENVEAVEEAPQETEIVEEIERNHKKIPYLDIYQELEKEGVFLQQNPFSGVLLVKEGVLP